MSSFRSAVLRPVKRRLGFASVIAASAFATAVVTGNSTAVVVVAVSVVVLGALIARTSNSGKHSQEKRTPGEPYSAEYGWEVNATPDLEEIAHALDREQLGLRPTSQSQHSVTLRGGSQLWLRLIGGYFINPRRLPVQVELASIRTPGSEKAKVQLKVQDTFGIAVRDEALEDRFMQAAANIRGVVGKRLEGMGGREVGSDASSLS